jgi:hypothetical protein
MSTCLTYFDLAFKITKDYRLQYNYFKTRNNSSFFLKIECLNKHRSAPNYPLLTIFYKMQVWINIE